MAQIKDIDMRIMGFQSTLQNEEDAITTLQTGKRCILVSLLMNMPGINSFMTPMYMWPGSMPPDRLPTASIARSISCPKNSGKRHGNWPDDTLMPKLWFQGITKMP